MSNTTCLTQPKLPVRSACDSRGNILSDASQLVRLCGLAGRSTREDNGVPARRSSIPHSGGGASYAVPQCRNRRVLDRCAVALSARCCRVKSRSFLANYTGSSPSRQHRSARFEAVRCGIDWRHLCGDDCDVELSHARNPRGRHATPPATPGPIRRGPVMEPCPVALFAGDR